MKQLVEIKNSKPNTLRIQYDLGNLCNYKCWYCFPGSNEGTSPWPDVNVVKINLARIIEFYFENNINEIHLIFLGGEPTLWKDLGKLIEHISNKTTFNRKEKKLRISVWTNGSRPISWWQRYGHYFDHVGISVHHERADLEHIARVAGVLLDKDVSVLATVLMDHTAWDKCKSIVDTLISAKPKFMVLARPVYINNVATYTDEQLKYLKNPRKRNPPLRSIIKHLDKFLNLTTYTAVYDDKSTKKTKSDHYFIVNNLNNFLGWECTLGINFLSINRGGTLSGTCATKLYGLNDYYNINHPKFLERFNPTLQPVICPRTVCSCASEVVLSKWKINKENKVIPIYEH